MWPRIRPSVHVVTWLTLFECLDLTHPLVQTHSQPVCRPTDRPPRHGTCHHKAPVRIYELVQAILPHMIAAFLRQPADNTRLRLVASIIRSESLRRGNVVIIEKDVGLRSTLRDGDYSMIMMVVVCKNATWLIATKRNGCRSKYRQYRQLRNQQTTTTMNTMGFSSCVIARQIKLIVAGCF